MMKGVGPIPVNNAVELKISQSSRYLDEGGTAPTFKVWLSDDPTGDVTVTLTLHRRNTVALTLTPSGPLTFTPTAWEEHDAQTVTVTVQDNAIIDADGRQRIDLAASGGGADGATARARFDFRDNDRPAVTLTASPNPVTEGTAVTITATLSEDPSADVTIPLEIPDPVDGEYTSPSTHAITIAGTGTGTTGTLDIQTNEDDNDIESETFTVGLDTDASDWPSNWGAGTPSSVAITIDDNDRRSVGIWANPNPVAEGSVVTIWVTLSEDPSADVTIPLEIPDPGDGEYTLPTTHAITIAGTGTGTTGTLEIQTNEDADRVDETFTVQLDMDSDDWPPEWDGEEIFWLTRRKIPITISDNDKPTVSLTASPNPVDEGSTVTITATLSEDPSADVTIPLEIAAPGHGEYTSPTTPEITIAGTGTGTTGALDIQTNEDDNDLEDETFTVELDMDDSDWPSGWGAGDPSSVKIKIADNDGPPDLEVSQSGTGLDEGGDSETFSVWLSKAPSANVTVTLTLDTGNSVALTLDPLGPLTFTPSVWDEDNAQTVTVSVPDNTILEADATQRINLAASGGGADGATESVDFDFYDNDKPELQVRQSGTGLDEGGDSETFSVWLSKAPSGDVTVTLNLDTGNSVALTLDPLGPLTFTPSAWDEDNAQTVTVSVPDNTILEADATQRINLAASGGGADGATESVDFDFYDNDKPELQVRQSGTGLDEGGDSETFSVWLSKAPSGDVTVGLTLDTGNSVALTLDPLGPLTFTPSAWDENNAQTVTVSVPDNAVLEADAIQRINLAASGGGADGATESVDFYFYDNDKPELQVSQSDTDLDEGGDSETFSVWLSKAPSGDVTVTLTLDTGNSVALTLDPLGPLTFSPSAWDENNAQTVTVSVPDNAVLEADAIQRINLAASGGGADGATESVGFYFYDNDKPELQVSQSDTDLEEGGDPETFSVWLSKAPSGDVTVTLTPDTENTAALTLDPSGPLTFTPTDWGTAQTVTVSVPDDDVEVAERWQDIDLAASGGGADGKTALVYFYFRDNDAALRVSQSDTVLDEGGDSETFSVWLSKAPSANVTVTLTLDTGNSVTLTLDPLGPFTFTPSAWDKDNAQTVTVSVPDDAVDDDDGWQFIYLAASGGGADGKTERVGFYFYDNDKATVSLAASPNPVDEGSAVTITATLSEDPITDVVIPLEIPNSGDGEYTSPDTHTITIAGTGSGTTGTLDIQTNEDATQ